MKTFSKNLTFLSQKEQSVALLNLEIKNPG